MQNDMSLDDFKSLISGTFQPHFSAEQPEQTLPLHEEEVKPKAKVEEKQEPQQAQSASELLLKLAEKKKQLLMAKYSSHDLAIG